jgi:hypothetical protein
VLVSVHFSISTTLKNTSKSNKNPGIIPQMKHLITILIITKALVIPYLLSKYFIFKNKPNDYYGFGLLVYL